MRTTTPMHEAYLDLAEPTHRERVRDVLRDGGTQPAWARRQRACLDAVDAYLAAERARPAAHLVQYHEAGGPWRIAFPHLLVRPDNATDQHLAAVMSARADYARAHYHANFPDCCEVHHDVETFLYFQMPLLYWRRPGWDQARASVAQVADHCLNRSADVPAWYDERTQGFVSTWLGTRDVRDRPPFDYQEANHFRFIDVCMAAWCAGGDDTLLERACAYAARWCQHIAKHADGGPVPCQILPPGAVVEEAGKAGEHSAADGVYQVFYSTMAGNTAYDIGMALLDLYRCTGEAHLLAAFRNLLDPFFEHLCDGRPPRAFAEGDWRYIPLDTPLDAKAAMAQGGVMLVRMALKHDLVTGTSRYRAPLLAWAEVIDETRFVPDQSAADLLFAAHHWTGDTAWLERAQAMILRMDAVSGGIEGVHGGNGDNCNAVTRYGSRFMMELLYLPLLAGVDFGTRGNVPDARLRHTPEGMPQDAAFRTWSDGDGAWHEEALGDMWTRTPCADAARPRAGAVG